MARRKASVLAAVLSAAAACVLGGCSATTEVTWQDNGTPCHTHPHQDWWQYQYVYYPNLQVYYEPYSGVWHWYERYQWRRGMNLPEHLNPHPQDARVVKLASEFPFEQHETAVAMRGPEQGAYPGSKSRRYLPNIMAARQRFAPQRQCERRPSPPKPILATIKPSLRRLSTARVDMTGATPAQLTRDDGFIRNRTAHRLATRATLRPNATATTTPRQLPAFEAFVHTMRATDRTTAAQPIDRPETRALSIEGAQHMTKRFAQSRRFSAQRWNRLSFVGTTRNGARTQRAPQAFVEAEAEEPMK